MDLVESVSMFRIILYGLAMVLFGQVILAFVSVGNPSIEINLLIYMLHLCCHVSVLTLK